MTMCGNIFAHAVKTVSGMQIFTLRNAQLFLITS